MFEPSPPSVGAESGPARTLAQWRRRLELLGRRRRFVVNKKYQYRHVLVTVAVALLLLLPLNFVYFVFSSSKAELVLAHAPELREMIHAQDRFGMSLVVGGSVVFLLGVCVLGILESHKTAGAAYHIARRMGEVGQRRLGGAMKLRKGDQLLELEDAFNAMRAALETNAGQEADILEALADDAERLGPETDASAVAARLRRLADEKRGWLA